MTIQGINIPQADIDRLPGTRKRILYALYEAHPCTIGVGVLYDAGGTGAPSRMKELNRDFLIPLGLMVDSKLAGMNENGTQVWEYGIVRIVPKWAEDSTGEKQGILPLENVKHAYLAPSGVDLG